MIVSPGDRDYPPLLAATPAPPTLHVCGTLVADDALAIAIVGSRRATTYGLEIAEQLASDLAARGVTIVSGLARGIDTAAHCGALDGAGAGGGTVAVLGTGVDVAYPPENAELMDRVVADGCVISEQWCGTPGAAYVFPRRNRIISGLSEGVVVVEGGVRSGALITARWALDQGREVGAVPGFPGDFRSAGPNGLLRDGAFVVEDAADVFANLPRLGVPAPAPTTDSSAGAVAALDAEARRVYDLVARGTHADDVARVSCLDIGRVQEILTRLEIEGLVVRSENGSFTRARR